MKYPDIHKGLVVCVLLLLLPAVSVHALTASELAQFQPNVTITADGTDRLRLQSNGVPTHEYGPYPNPPNNPNEVLPQSIDLSIPETPAFASEATCLPMGTIGITLYGVAFYNPYTILITDAVENEVMDDCGGHPSPNGMYHYHQAPHCDYRQENNQLLGVAIDGFPIYGTKDENGVELTSADLDMCHGRWYEGEYRYHITADFPYILGCFRGHVELSDRQLRDCHMAIADDYDDASALTPTATLLSLAALISYWH